MLNFFKAVITFFGGFALLLALFITVFLIIYIGYLVVILIVIGVIIYTIKMGFDAKGVQS